MRSLYKRKRLTVITIAYWFLLTYILTALVFWFISLLKQNEQMSSYKMMQLKMDQPDYINRVAEIETERRKKEFQYIGEGATFMLLILVGAVFVYRATRKQIRLNNQQQNFMMAVTHELKTPIAVAKLNLETMLKRKLEGAQQEKLLDNTLKEANRLNDLCNNILLASQIDSGNYLLDNQEINFTELVYESVDYFKTRFPAFTIVEEQIEEGIYVKGDDLLLQLAVNNLIDNAIKYSGRQKVVTISLKKNDSNVLLEIKDEGEGISGAEKKRIFEKFYRSGNENTRQTKGTGLGLYLTKKIIKDHSGIIKVTDNIPSGCIFAITLHTAEPA
ncbi:two-component sensor histidine kinase [Terrimonas sp.]|uniref:sensor histidine kinase n=1 Tax=Terrimonas sp. TaxID=1914338 RepID=UPI000D51846A|nr:ATP-binding protein [Terrimonas sp.]PVD49824.1 two-component sensor histidine kinase [Terrimonas sp.]